MKVVRPIEITEAVLTASSIPEPDASVGEIEWQQKNNEVVISSTILIEGACTDGSHYYVVEFSGDKVRQFDLNWIATGFEFSVTSQANAPLGICFDGVNFNVLDRTTTDLFSYAPNGVYTGTSINTVANAEYVEWDGTYFNVTNSANSTIQRILPNGTLDSTWSAAASGAGRITGISFRSGFFYITYTSNLIRKFSITGDYQNFEISLGDITNEPYSLKGIVVDEKINQLAGVSSNGRVFKYEINGEKDNRYQVGERVIKNSTHKLYECTIATADDPEAGVDKKPQTWVEVGPTNKWAAFDDKKSTKSKSSSPYTTQLVPGVTIDSLAGFAISGATDVTIVATSESAGEVFNETINLLNIDLAYDFYTWYTYELDYIDEFVVTNIPPYPDLIIDISFTGSVIEIGNIVTGRGRNLGVLQTGVISDRVDYSRTTIDDFGEETTVIRPITKYSTYPVVIEKVQAPGVLRFLDGLRGLKCVWIGDIGNNQNLTTFGSIERSPLVYDNLSISEYQIKVRGSI